MTAEQLEKWLVEQLAAQLRVPATDIDPVRRLEEYGLDSLEALALTGEIEALLHRPVDPTILWDYPSIRAVATFLAIEPAARSAGAAMGAHEAANDNRLGS
jgi:acyl carrier protein